MGGGGRRNDICVVCESEGWREKTNTSCVRVPEQSNLRYPTRIVGGKVFLKGKGGVEKKKKKGCIRRVCVCVRRC